MSGSIILASGDSWTYGSELYASELLIDPAKGVTVGNIIPGKADYHTYNDYYRIPRIWPTLVAAALNANVTNIGIGAASNDTIYNNTVGWILRNYVVPRRDTSELLVIVGWSSPERKTVLLSDQKSKINKVTFWPAMEDLSFYKNNITKQYFKFYVTYLWHEYEYIYHG
jgi:hypothetical protein